MRTSPALRAWALVILVVFVARTGAAQVIRGQVVDSISGQPLAGSVIGLLGPAGDSIATTRTDPEGLFLLRAPSGGQYRLRVHAARYRESVFPQFALGVDDVRGFLLLVAPLDAPPVMERNDIARAVCPDSPEQPIAIGIVRDAAGRPVDGAVVTFSWDALPDILGTLADASGVDAGRAAVTTDSTGLYAMCDLPSGTRIALHASAPGRRSAFVSLAYQPDSTWVDGFAHYADPPLWRQDLTLNGAEAWTAQLSGRVIDAASREPVSGALVTVATTSVETRTDSMGAFRLSRLPEGFAALTVQKIGYRARRHHITLVNDEPHSIPADSLTLESAPRQLAPIVARAEADAIARPLEGFRERRARGMGSFLTREEWQRQGNPGRPTDVLTRMQGVSVRPNPTYHTRGGPRWVVRTTRGTARAGFGEPGACPPIYFLDGMYMGNSDAYDVDSALPFGDIVAVEAYSTVAALPQRFNRAGAVCGVILFWTGR